MTTLAPSPTEAAEVIGKEHPIVPRRHQQGLAPQAQGEACQGVQARGRRGLLAGDAGVGRPGVPEREGGALGDGEERGVGGGCSWGVYVSVCERMGGRPLPLPFLLGATPTTFHPQNDNDNLPVGTYATAAGGCHSRCTASVAGAPGASKPVNANVLA